MEGQNTIAAVVAAGLCTGCGTCVAVCPEHAISMQENPAGLLLAHVDPDTCNHCGFCFQICPGSHLEQPPIPDHVDPFKGKVLAVFCGYATDPNVRAAAQSGGIVTAVSNYLIASGQIRKALVTTMPANGSLRPQAALHSSPQDILAAQASKYCPVAVNAALPARLMDTIATVGLACHVHGIRNAQIYKKDWQDHIPLLIGLFCDCTLTFEAIEYLIQKGRVSRNTVRSLRYKDKRYGQFPGNGVIQTTNNQTIQVPNAHRLRGKRLFKAPRCFLCFDKVNVFSDIAVGDTWGIVKSTEGMSVALARTDQGLQTLLDAQKAGFLVLEPVDAEAVFHGQRVESRRRAWATYAHLWEQQKRPLPEFHIPLAYQDVPEGGKKYNTLRHDFAWACRLASCETPEDVTRTVRRHQWWLWAGELLTLPGRLFRKILSWFSALL